MTSKERPLIVYFSGTGQTEKLVNKINPDNSFETLRVKTGKEVIGTGNKQWGKFFCGAGRTISNMFNIPLIAKVEQSGHFNEVENILNYFKENYKVIGA